MIEVLKQAAEDVSKAYDVLAFAHTERALELLAKTRTSLRQAIAGLESQEPVGRFTGKFTVDAHDRMLCEVVCSNAIPTAGAALYDAPPPFRPQNFCPRCGKRTNDIHTCTPPQEKNT
jgi:hypothetical protein